MQKLMFVVCLVTAVALPGITAAATLTSGPFPTSTPVPLTLTDWAGSLQFPQFNPALGTLTMVQLDLNGSMETVLTITNSSPDASSGTGRTEVQMTVQDAGGKLIAPQIDLYSPDYAYNLGPNGSTTSGTLTKSGTSSDQYTDPIVLAEFTGLGNIVLPASTFTQTWLTNTGGNTYAAQVTQAELTGTVTYFYTPEPATLGLLALGSLFIARRRRTA